MLKLAQAVQWFYGEMGGRGSAPPVLHSGPGCPPSVVLFASDSPKEGAPGGTAGLCSSDGIEGSTNVPGVMELQTLGKHEWDGLAFAAFVIASLT